MPASDLNKQCTQHKEEGNEKYKSGDFHSSVKCYTQGISSFVAADFRKQRPVADDLILLASLLTNRAQAAIKEYDFAQALAVSTHT